MKSEPVLSADVLAPREVDLLLPFPGGVEIFELTADETGEYPDKL